MDTSTPATDAASSAEATEPARTHVGVGARISTTVAFWLVEIINELTQPTGPFPELRSRMRYDVAFHTVPAEDTQQWVPVIAAMMEIQLADGRFVYASPIWPASGITRQGVYATVSKALLQLVAAEKDPAASGIPTDPELLI